MLHGYMKLYLTRFFHKICDSYAVEKVAEKLIKLDPHWQSTAFCVSRTAFGLFISETCHGREASLGQTEDLADCTSLRLPAESVAAALSVDTFYNIVFGQHRKYLLEVFKRYLLPACYLLHRDKLLSAVLGKINDYAQGVSASCGNCHDKVLRSALPGARILNLFYFDGHL